MNKKIIDELVELEIYSSKSLTEEEFNQQAKDNKQGEFVYSSGSINFVDGNSTKWFKQIDTKGLSNEEIKLLLEIDRTKNIRSIKKMAIFFVVLTLISVAIAIWSGASIASML